MISYFNLYGLMYFVIIISFDVLFYVSLFLNPVTYDDGSQQFSISQPIAIIPLTCKT